MNIETFVAKKLIDVDDREVEFIEQLITNFR